jgi:hypothetical protein
VLPRRLFILFIERGFPTVQVQIMKKNIRTQRKYVSNENELYMTEMAGPTQNTEKLTATQNLIFRRKKITQKKFFFRTLKVKRSQKLVSELPTISAWGLKNNKTHFFFFFSISIYLFKKMP